MKRKNMSKKFAVLYSYNMWAWLELHPGKTKDDYLRSNPSLDRASFMSCSLCHYARNHMPEHCVHSCEKCPMFFKWKHPQGFARTCDIGGTFYRRWLNNLGTRYSEKDHSAGNLAGELWALYKKLGG